jgi:hypothetical protein
MTPGLAGSHDLGQIRLSETVDHFDNHHNYEKPGNRMSSFQIYDIQATGSERLLWHEIFSLGQPEITSRDIQFVTNTYGGGNCKTQKKGVTPAKAGVQKFLKRLDSRFRGNRPCMGHSPRVMKQVLARYGCGYIFVKWGWWPKDVVI